MQTLQSLNMWHPSNHGGSKEQALMTLSPSPAFRMHGADSIPGGHQR